MKRWQIGLNIILEIVTFIIGALILIYLIPKLLGFFWPFVVSWILAALASPLCNMLEKHIRLNKKWSSAFIIIFVLCALAGALYLLIVKLGKEMISFLSSAPTYYAYFQNTLNLLGERIGSIASPVSSDLGSQIQQMFNDLLMQIGTAINSFAPQGADVLGSVASNITSGFVGFVVMIIAAYFFIADRDKLSAKLMKILPEDVWIHARDIKNNLMSAIGGFLLAQLKIMCIIFVELLIGLALLRNPYAFFLALLIAFLDLLPIPGTGTVLIPWALIMFIQGSFRLGIALLIIYVVCLFTRQLLQPKIIGESMGMDTLTTLFLIYTGFKLHGMSGMILALFAGTIVMAMYRLGLFDKRIKRLYALVREYRDYEKKADR
ncbi:MAG: sporulation integral membrane protein YtvI [Clostridiales bacterium]|nr:sporulation integral membrane protein YtvI [Clostridiales bacterium]